MTGIAFSMLIGIFTDHLLGHRQMNKWMKLAVSFICVLAVGLCIGVCVITHEWNIEFLWGAGFCVLVAAIFLIITVRKTIPAIHVFAILFCLLILDLGAINFVNMDFRSKESVINEKSLLGDWLSKQAGKFRVYSPSYSIPQLTAVHSGLELADGINPMQLQIYDNFMRTASGVPGEEYSVTLPRFSTGQPDVNNQYSVPSPQLLGFLNVKYICSEFPLNIEGLEFVKKIDSTWIYENRYMQNRVWMQKTSALTAGESEPLSSQLTIEKYVPNQILIQSNGEEGILVLSEIMYPGWKVTVDGKQANMTAVGGLLRGVEISTGEHEVEFIFRPVLVYLSAGISIFTFIVIIFFSIKENKSTGKNV
ncbi:MAG: YfhO family protein [Chloroflexi bacterium]|nr:YfhO family protein [Chloroflexota bacterium]